MDIASRADSGQWQFTSAKICSPPNTRETKRESLDARSGYRITSPRGIWGWPAYKDRDRMRATERWGIPQEVDAERERTSISRTPLNSNIQLSLSLAQDFLFETLFYSFLSKYSFMTKYRKFLSICTTLDWSKIPFSLYEFYYLHRNLTTIYNLLKY